MCNIKKSIKEYAGELFSKYGTSISSKDIPINCDDDYILSIRLLSEFEQGCGYALEITDENVNKGKYTIPLFTLIKESL